MQNLQTFNFEKIPVRIVTVKNEIYFVGKDVAKILGYKDTSSAVSKHIDNEDKTTLPFQQDGSNYKTRITIINESGLYSLILKSKLPKAKEFKRWVTSEVLPSIRKHGAYLTDSKINEVLSDPDTLINLATQLKAEKQKVESLSQDLTVAKPKVEYHDLVLNNETLLTVNQIAKDYGLSARGFNMLLHDLGIQYKQSDTWHLYAKYQTYGYTQTQAYYDHKGNVVSTITKWTQSGKKFLYNHLKAHDIYPVALIPPIEYVDDKQNIFNAKTYIPHYKFEQIQLKYGGKR